MTGADGSVFDDFLSFMDDFAAIGEAKRHKVTRILGRENLILIAWFLE